jgi:hypothetical protein
MLAAEDIVVVGRKAVVDHKWAAEDIPGPELGMTDWQHNWVAGGSIPASLHSSLQLQEFDMVVGDSHMEEVAADSHQGMDGDLESY